MTERLDEVIARLRELPEKVRDAVADALLANLDSFAEIEAEYTRQVGAEL